MGQEIVVDPRTGLWYTVGDSGAEFRDIPKGAIVFNHLQTESLLANGYAIGRASALAAGTAMVTGGIKRSNAARSSAVSSGGTTWSGSSGGSDNTASAETEEPEREVIDWIEIAVDRIERSIKKLTDIADSAFVKIDQRLAANNNAIKQTNEEIALQDRAYNRYMAQANSVGLSADLAAMVRNGSIDIIEYDKDTAEKIQKYQEYFEKAIESQERMIELGNEIGEMYKDNFDMLADEYENQISLLEHLTNAYDNSMENIELRGYLATKTLYQAKKEVAQNSLTVLNAELSELVASMAEAVDSGAIEEGSEAWYEMQQEINDVREEIQEATNSVLEMNKAIREVDWERFDYVQEQIAQVNDEAQFYIDLMENSDLFDDTGKITKKGMATMGLYAEKYNVYMEQADAYAKEVKAIEEEMANDPYNTELIERRNELLEAQRDSILAAEDEKQAIIDLVEDGIEKELDALKELIDKYNEAIDATNDLYDYQKKVKDQTSEIASLQKQIAAYTGDTSEETRSKVQKLQVELTDAMEALAETEYEYYISEQKKMLDNLYDEYEEVLNQRLDDVDALIQSCIDTVNDNSVSISNTLHEVGEEVGYTMTEANNAIWANSGLGYAVVEKYGTDIAGRITSVESVLENIYTKVAIMAQKAEAEAAAQKAAEERAAAEAAAAAQRQQEQAAAAAAAAAAQPSGASGDVVRGIAAAIWIYGGAESGWGNGSERVNKLTQKFGASTAAQVQDYINAHADNGDLYNYWASTGYAGLSQYYYSAFKKGGLAKYTGPAWIDGTEREPEAVLNAEDTKNFLALRDAMQKVANGTSPLSSLFGEGTAENLMSKLSSIGDILASGGTSIGSVTYQINIPIDHVEDYKDFMNQMRSDRQFEDLIQSMTIDRLSGGSKIAKNKYRW